MVGGGEGVADVGVAEVGEEAGVGAPGLGVEGSLDFLVFDDVWPVFDDPGLPVALPGDRAIEESSGVVEAELTVLELADRVQHLPGVSQHQHAVVCRDRLDGGTGTRLPGPHHA